MSNQSRWEKYPATYREKEMKLLADWIAAGESGAVVGLPGMGRATLLNVLCRRPEILQMHLNTQNRQAVLVPVDLNNLPDKDLATLYRVVLRSFYENRERFDESIHKLIISLYQKHETTRDPFLPQSGLRELLLKFEEEEKKVVLVMNRFDRFCKNATSRMTWTLRGLRDSFKGTLCFIMGMSQEVAYLSELTSIEPLRSILDTHVLWVGPLSANDAKDMIRQESQIELDDNAIKTLTFLSGRCPSLIRIACYWWPDIDGNQNFREKLLNKTNVQHRLFTIFDSLTQEEQSLLRDVAHHRNKKGSKLLANPTEYEQTVLESLIKKGICQKTGEKWEVISQLMEIYPSQAPGQSWGRIWWNKNTGQICQGIKPVDELTPLEENCLEFFIKNPQRRLTYTEIAEGAWPDENAGAVTPEAIQQAIRGVRKKVEPKPSNPSYIISWRGQPEGGYQFFPEGRPN